MTNDVLVFDMDGTLYYSDTFIGNYIKYLSGDEKIQQNMMDDFHKIANEFSKTDHTTFTYSGQPLGDLWQILFFVADKYGVSETHNHTAFINTRKQMISGKEITINDELIKTIKDLSIPKILMTNSPKNSAIPFLDYLGLNNMFEMYIYDAKKPFSMKEHVEKIQQQYPGHNIIKIGDNLHNDIQSSNSIGIGSIYINHFNDSFLNKVTLYSLEHLNDYLKLNYMEV